MMLPSGVIWGVTSSLRLALRNATAVAPLAVAIWNGNSVPCSINALRLVGCDHAGAGHHFAFAISLKC